MGTMKQIIERLKTRQNNTERAKKDTGKILNWISDKMTDELTGYGTENVFQIRSTHWNGRNWCFNKGTANFKIKNGIATVAYAGDFEETSEIVDIEELNYINIHDVAAAMEEFLNSLTKIETFEESAERLHRAAEELEKTE